MDTVYITGHKNPDTDSIISAMAYAALKNALGQRQYKAARLGQVSDETQIVLDRFGFEAPELITDVRTQVRDLDYDTPTMLSPGATISRAWQIMHDEKISSLPVANEDGTLYGMLSAGDVASYDMNSVYNPVVEEVPIYNLLSVLEGMILNSGGEMNISSGGTADNTMVNSDGDMYISFGGIHRGSLQLESGATVSAYSGAIIDFTLTDRTAEDGYLINNLSLIKGTPTYTITV